MSLSIQNIHKTYGKQKALLDVSFRAGKGEIIGLLGPNGAGKSTLMKIICGYLDPDSGETKVADLHVSENPLLVKSKIGYLPENNSLYKEMYVKEYLLFIANVYRLKNRSEIVSEMIKKVGLSAEQHKKIEQLSKGYQQRVGIAAALMHQPEVLILDEPTTGLDPNQIIEIRNLIKEVGRNKTVLLSTHIMQEVDKMCSRVIILSKGKIVDDRPIEYFSEKKKDLEEYFRQLTT